MKKKLINSDDELVALLINCEHVEEILGFEFAFVDGRFQSDIYNDPSIDEDQEISKTIYRKGEINGFPEHYPCVVVWGVENDWDRCGNLSIEIIEFVYLTDFVKEN